MSKINDDLYSVGKKLILAGIKADEALADLLKTEVKRIKKIIRENGSIDDIQRSNILLKNTIIALIVTEEKISAGISLCKNSKKTVQHR